MKSLTEIYLEKYSEELNSLVNCYQVSGNISEQTLDKLHLELVGLFQRSLGEILDHLIAAPSQLAPPRTLDL